MAKKSSWYVYVFAFVNERAGICKILYWYFSFY